MRPERKPGPPALVLYDYWRSSACYRVRIALNLKSLPYEQQPIDLVLDGGRQHSEDYLELNPQGLVPTLVHDGKVLTQSLAIIEYLEETFMGNPLFPDDPNQKAFVRSMALSIACDIHPLNNLRVQRYLKGNLDVSADQTTTWMNYWVSVGFESLEQRLQNSDATGLCCMGDHPGLVDCFLIPQVYNAERFDCDLSGFPLIQKIAHFCRSLPAFQAALPENQPDSAPG